MSVPANFFDTYNVVAAPADDQETVVAILTGVGELLPNLAVNLHGWVDIIPDADVVGITLTVHRDSISGQQVGNPVAVGMSPAGTLTEALPTIDVVDFPGDFANATYVLTVTCASAGGASQVNSVHLSARTC